MAEHKIKERQKILVVTIFTLSIIIVLSVFILNYTGAALGEFMAYPEIFLFVLIIMIVVDGIVFYLYKKK